jgi:hypothetical protein
MALLPTAPADTTPIHVPAWAWLVAALSVFAAYLMTMENGMLLGHAAGNVHELFHDARHFLAVPCH